MVVFAIGGVIVGGVIGTLTYDDCSGYDDYSYSDAAQRRKKENEMKKNALEEERTELVKKMNNLKDSEMKTFLENTRFQSYKSDDFTSDDLKSMNMEAYTKIENKKNKEIQEQCNYIRKEISKVDDAINELENLRKKINQK